MNRHASMNRIFRLVWNESLNAYVPAAETARGRGKSSKRKLIATALSVSVSVGIAQAGPTGGQVTAGSGTITSSGATTTIQQSSQNLSLNWQTFNIAPQETVNFLQPNASAIAVNRIVGTNGSTILGHLNANGQVYLINPNGVLFGKGAEVNVGGLVASTLNLNDSTLGDTSKTFSGTSSGTIVNDGTLTAAAGGTIALLGNHVSNMGAISAQLGTVALGAGSAVTLTFSGTHLVSMQVDQSVLNSVAANGGLIRADGGTVLMTAGAQKSLLASLVNNTGVIEARTLENHDGTIKLLGGMTAGAVNVAGTLDASAPNAGNGGSVETSAAHVTVAADAKVTTAAAMGLSGTWLIDPTDFTIGAGNGSPTVSGIGATTLQAELANGNVSIATDNTGTQNGDINVNAPLSWSANKLALTAAGDINVNAIMTVSGSGNLDLAPATNNVNMNFNPDGTFAGRIDFSGSGTLRMNVAGTLQTFTVINSLGVASDASSGSNQTLQGMARTANLSGYFALGTNVDASATAGWNPCTACSATLGAGHYGFKPIGGDIAPNSFTGVFDGLGHVISNLSTSHPNNPANPNGPGTFYVGLFGYGATNSVFRNVGLENVNILGGHNVGALVGKAFQYGSVSNSYSTGSVMGTGAVGGLIGTSGYGRQITNDYSFATVSGRAGELSYSIGGLIGDTTGNIISNSHSTGQVSGSEYVGGLVGNDYGGSQITKSYATGSVSAAGYNNGSATVSYVGGLVGYGGSSLIGAGITISNSYATGAVHAAANSTAAGGLVGYTYTGSVIDHSYSTSAVTGGANSVGGLVGLNYGSITNSYATGVLNGSNNTGGLVGSNSGSIATSYATGAVGGASAVGGLVGMNYASASITTSHASSLVIGTGNNVGGLVGQNYGSIAMSFATGAVSGGKYTGGLVGYNEHLATVTTSYATGSVSGGRYTGGLVGTNDGAVSTSFENGDVSGTLNVGGLFGSNGGPGLGTLTNSYATGNVSGGNVLGGLVGFNYGLVTNSYATGSVSSTSGGTDVGGLVGLNFATVNNSFYNTSANPGLTGISGGADSAGVVIGMTPAQLQTQANFTSSTSANGSVNPSWDFGATWVMYEGHTNPLLQAFMTPLTVIGTIAKTYDGATFAPSVSNLTYSTTPDFSHIFGTVTVTGNAVGAVHAGAYSYTPGGLYSDQLGYIFTFSPSTLTINPAPLTVIGTTANKVYDGTTLAILTGATLSGLVVGDNVTFSESGTYGSVHAGTGIPVSVTATVSGASATDYILTQPTGVIGTISPAPLSVNGTTVGNKVYNGTTVASLAGGTLSGVISGDTVTLTQAGNFASKNAGTGIGVSASDSIGGVSASDYTLVEPIGLSANIAPATLMVTGTAVGSKVYDGTDVAPVMGGSLVGVVIGDTVTLNQSGTFANANVGTGIAVSAADSLSGADASNYSIVEPTGLTGTILPAPNSLNGSSDLVLAALNARTQIVENFIYPQLGANPQVINASPTIAVLATSADDAGETTTGSHQAIAVNVSMKIGANGTLKIENGGLRLPSNLVVGNE